jgi:exosortase J
MNQPQSLSATDALVLSPTRRREFPLRAGVALAGLLAVLGVSTIWSTALPLWELWTTDALKSIGMLVPLVSFVLILRAWRSLDWEMDGTWWGFALLAGVSLLVRLRAQSVMVLVLAPQWSLYFPPHSLVAFAYGAGVVLLFGGVRLFRAALFPLVLLLAVNPVPHVFNVYVDLPLQRVSAHIARGFAIALGQPLSPDKLRLMFTPNFGMFIAPGCNGIRGAVTMGFIALVAGYLYRFRWQAHAAVVAGAILLGYVFNFVRLCVLVLYYIVALHLPWLKSRAENADYLIGAGLFLLAVYLLYLAIQRLGAKQELAAAGVRNLPPADTAQRSGPPATFGLHFALRAAAMSVLVALGLVGVVRFFTAVRPNAALVTDSMRMGEFSPSVGSYTLVRTWNETLLSGALLFHWAEYAPAGGGTHLSIGISPVLGSHDTMICHSARGEDPLWHGESTFQTAQSAVSFSSSFYNDGATQSLEVTTLCNGSSCGEYSSPRAHFGFVYSKVHPQTLLAQNPERPIPILLKAETIDTTLPAGVARERLAADVASFLSGVDLDALTKPYRRASAS